MHVPILHEDHSILIINKPSGLLVHAIGDMREAMGDESRTERAETVIDWLANHYPGIAEGEWPDPSRPGIVHRLDRDTSGVMVIAKSPDVLANLQEQFAKRRVKKHYLVLIVGMPEWSEQTVRAPVARSEGTRRRAQYLRLDDRAKDAETHFSLLKSFQISPRPLNYDRSLMGGVSLLEAQPKTGRTHQIRVHLGLLGYPILGDRWYSTKVSRALTKELNVSRLMLHAQKLSFKHPAIGEWVTFEAPLPEDFNAIVKSLRPAR